MTLLSSLLLNGCSVPHTASPVPGPQEPAAHYSPQLGAASSLYLQAEKSLRQGQYHQAELELERALRIEPRNGDYWYAMARVKSGQNLHKETIQFCLKSKSLAGKNRQLIQLNDALIDKARQQQ